MIRNPNAPRIVPAVVASILLLAGTGAAAQDVYQWKDAQGVTHYSEAPPKTGSYQQRDVNRDRAPVTAAATSAPATAKAPADNKSAAGAQCATTRQNLALLESKNSVQQDVDGDGKPDKTLDANERANQLELARAQLKAQNCGT